MAPARESILREGICAGLIGAAVVAVWFLLLDLWRGQPFLTPGLLGAAVFQGVNAFATVDLSAFYADVAKDRLYTFAARSPQRRASRQNRCHP